MRDFCPGGRLVLVGWRRAYLARRPTVAAVFAALERFGPEIAALRSLYDAGEIRAVEAIRRGVAALVARPVDAAEVLSLCVDSPGLDRAGVTARLALRPRDVEAVAGAVLAQADLARIWGSLEVGKVEREPARKGGLLSLCQSAGVSPVEVASWPYEALLGAIEEARGLVDTPEDEGAVEGAAVPGVALIGGPGRAN